MPSKSKLVKGNRTSNESKRERGWELALERAKSALYKNKVQRTRLTAAIRVFQEKIRNDEPWPTEQAAE
jgi:hypothetical protein